MVFRKNCVYIYTDGSSLQRPRKGGMGIRYIYLDINEEEKRIDIDEMGYKGATNNQMELKAVIYGIKNLSKQLIEAKYNSIEVRTDSRYVVDNVNNSIYNWSKNGWLNYNKKPIENASLWKELIKELRTLRCCFKFEWVRGHSKDPDNKAVDKLAKVSAKGELKNPLNIVKLRRKKSNQKTRQGSVMMNGQRISIHIINEEFLRIQKISKYRYEVISKNNKFLGNVDHIYSDIHHLKAGHAYYVVLNKDNNNPRIMKLIKELNK
ncbi:MAG: ribonuclease H [Saprospiraceae bacterium]